MRTLKEMPKPDEYLIRGSLGKFRLEETHTYLTELTKSLGPIYRLRILSKRMVVVSDPIVVGQILKSRPEKFRRVRQIESVFSELGMHGTFSTEGESWHNHRKLLNPAFRPSTVKHYLSTIQTIVNRLCKVINRHADEEIDSAPFDFQVLIQQFSVDVTSSLAFGFDLNTLENPESELQRAFEVIFTQIASRLKSPIPYWRYIKFQKDRELEKAMVLVKLTGKKFIQTATDRMKGGAEPNSLLENMIYYGDASSEDILGNVITLLLAGEDTTANTIAWVMHYLIDDLELQRDLFEEVDQHYPRNEVLAWQDLGKFQLVNGAVKESIRLKPVAPLLYLEPTIDQEILGYNIPAGTMTTVLLSSSSFDSLVFENPSRFDPRRWLNVEIDQAASGMLHPFGNGSRQCPGMQLALIEAKMVLIELIRQFEFSRVSATTESFEFTVKPRNLVVSAKRRVERKQIPSTDVYSNESPVGVM